MRMVAMFPRFPFVCCLPGRVLSFWSCSVSFGGINQSQMDERGTSNLTFTFTVTEMSGRVFMVEGMLFAKFSAQACSAFPLW